MSTFVDGAAIDAGACADDACPYGFYGVTTGVNVARPRPDQLSPALAGLNLLSPIYLGGRIDHTGSAHSRVEWRC